MAAASSMSGGSALPCACAVYIINAGFTPTSCNKCHKMLSELAGIPPRSKSKHAHSGCALVQMTTGEVKHVMQTVRRRFSSADITAVLAERGATNKAAAVAGVAAGSTAAAQRRVDGVATSSSKRCALHLDDDNDDDDDFEPRPFNVCNEHAVVSDRCVCSNTSPELLCPHWNGVLVLGSKRTRIAGSDEEEDEPILLRFQK